jgi:hypothetical protein
MAIWAGGIAKRHSFIVASEPLQVVICLGLIAAIFCFFFKKKVPAAQTQAKATQQPAAQNHSDPNPVALQRKFDEVQALEAKAPPQLSPHQSLVASSAPDAHKYPMSKVFSPQGGFPASGIIAQESRRTSNARIDSCASNTTVEAMMTVEHSPRGPARTIGLGRLSYTSSEIGTYSCMFVCVCVYICRQKGLRLCRRCVPHESSPLSLYIYLSIYIYAGEATKPTKLLSLALSLYIHV